MSRFGASNPLWFTIDPLSPPPPAPAYHTAYDRAPGLPGAAWESGPPNGSVTVGDIIAVVTQFGYNCIAGDPVVADMIDIMAQREYMQDVVAPIGAALTAGKATGGGQLPMGAAVAAMPPGGTIICVTADGTVVFTLPPPPFMTDTGELEMTEETPGPTPTVPADDGDVMSPIEEDDGEGGEPSGPPC